jgi:hypothetical protein
VGYEEERESRKREALIIRQYMTTLFMIFNAFQMVCISQQLQKLRSLFALYNVIADSDIGYPFLGVYLERYRSNSFTFKAIVACIQALLERRCI